MLSVKNCPEFLRQALEDWCQANGQPGKPNQNACIERSNCTCRNKALNLYLFRSLQEVREIAGRWVDECNDR